MANFMANSFAHDTREETFFQITSNSDELASELLENNEKCFLGTTYIDICLSLYKYVTTQ